ncbi:hypothetical protein CEUSTIGMA_g7273.t1 [Chlamydomonas eustigma]|uniref:Uncharacterized protein n=1 Tax=Chlamydomonas eustigma TaxID=1157962 RepID=A0A250X9P4_9CHLO|nr:hypothetical protein CEUSTIGMA_g7273.t1 [Chlamydomonas eustigma]|eukprot:GAX79833.1 hypothetical protein CEUSTIGMA_g7273.t1 [Chlamydomonas eustigma]
MSSFHPFLSFDQWSEKLLTRSQSLSDNHDSNSSYNLQFENLRALWCKLKSPCCSKSDISRAQKVIKLLALPAASALKTSESTYSKKENTEAPANQNEAWESIKQAIFFGSHAVMFLSQSITTATRASDNAQMEHCILPSIKPFLQECMDSISTCCVWIRQSVHELHDADRDMRAVLKLLRTLFMNQAAAVHCGHISSSASLSEVFILLVNSQTDNNCHPFLGILEELLRQHDSRGDKSGPTRAVKAASMIASKSVGKQKQLLIDGNPVSHRGSGGTATLLCDCLLIAAHKCSTQHAYHLIFMLAHVTAKGLLSSAVPQDSIAIEESLENSDCGAMITCAQAEVCLQALTSALVRLADPLLAALAIKPLLPAQGSGRPISRRLLLDVATFILTCSEFGDPIFYLAFSMLMAGCQDHDASLRAKALSGFSEYDLIGKVVMDDDSNMSRQDSSSPSSKDLEIQLINMVKLRLVDTAKSVRFKALSVATFALSMEFNQARLCTQKIKERSSGFKCLALQSWLPELCTLSSPAPGSGFNDETSKRVIIEALQTIGASLVPSDLFTVLLSILLPPLKRGGTGDDENDVTLTGTLVSSLLQTIKFGCQIETKKSFDLLEKHIMAIMFQNTKPYLRTAVDAFRHQLTCELSPCLISLKQEAFARLYIAISPKSECAATLCGSASGFPNNTPTKDTVVGILCTFIILYSLSSEHKKQHMEGSQDQCAELGIILKALMYVLRSVSSVSCVRTGDGETADEGLTLPIMATGETIEARKQGEKVAAVEGRVSSSVLMFLSHHIPALLAGYSLEVADLAIALICSCPGSQQIVQALLHMIERNILDNAISRTLIEPGRESPEFLNITYAPNPAHLRAEIPLREASIYLLALHHATGLCRADVTDFRLSFRQHATFESSFHKADDNSNADLQKSSHSAKEQLDGQCNNVAISNPAEHLMPDPETDVEQIHQRDQHLGVDHEEDYMKQEEQEQQIEEAVRHYTEELLNSDSLRLADRVPLLLHIMAQGAGHAPIACVQTNLGDSECNTLHLLQLLSVRALGGLMSLSERLAHQHSHILADILRNFCNFEASNTSEVKERSETGGRDKDGRTQEGPQLTVVVGSVKLASSATPQSLRLVLEAINIAEEMILGWPNMNSWLFQELEGFIMKLLNSISMFKESRTENGSESAVESNSVILAALEHSILSFSRMLAANKLQILSSTYSVLGCILLAPLKMAQQSSEQCVLKLMGSLSTLAPKKTIKASSTKWTSTNRYRTLMSLYSCSSEERRLELVEKVLLSRLLQPADLENEALVLPVLNSLLVASSPTSQSAAASFLAHMTPSARAISLLLTALEDARTSVLSFPLKVLQDLKVFLQHFKQCPCSSHDGSTDNLSVTEGGHDEHLGVQGLKTKEATARSAYSALILVLDTAIACSVKGKKRKQHGCRNSVQPHQVKTSNAGSLNRALLMRQIEEFTTCKS